MILKIQQSFYPSLENCYGKELSFLLKEIEVLYGRQINCQIKRNGDINIAQSDEVEKTRVRVRAFSSVISNNSHQRGLSENDSVFIPRRVSDDEMAVIKVNLSHQYVFRWLNPQKGCYE